MPQPQEYFDLGNISILTTGVKETFAKLTVWIEYEVYMICNDYQCTDCIKQLSVYTNVI